MTPGVTNPGGGAPIPWLRLQTPNGHKILPDGTHWVADFTDPQSTREERELRHSRVFYMDQQQRMSLVADSLCYPNGVIVRGDGRVLYVNDSCDNRVYPFPVLRPGRAGA